MRKKLSVVFILLFFIFSFTGLNIAQSDKINYDESKVPNFTLPNSLILDNGSRVADNNAWIKKRRGEILELFETYVYGKSPDRPKNVSFKVCDVRSMETIENDYFDFILFSFNGIDYISHWDRLMAFEEIKRVGKNGGFFCFSTHNLQGIDQVFTLQASFNPIKILWRISKYLILRFWVLNRNVIEKLKKENYAIINDGDHLLP